MSFVFLLMRQRLKGQAEVGSHIVLGETVTKLTIVTNAESGILADGEVEPGINDCHVIGKTHALNCETRTGQEVVRAFR